MTRFANRTRELERFRQMLQQQIPERILLIEAPSGYGKTGLMARFAKLCPQYSRTIRTVPVDLKAAQEGIAYVFSRIARKLGTRHFSQFNAEIDRFLNSGVEIGNNRLTGEGSQIQVILNVPPEERQYRLTRLQQVFFEDLDRFNRPIVFILDTYNRATEELAEWIESQFLTEVADNENLFAIVAGQNIPQPNIEWQHLHHCCKLDRILERDAWYDYAQEAGFVFSPQEINMVVDAVGGVPAQVVQLLESAAQTRQQT
ncbi:MAG: hypothetical protein WBD58_01845 [Geitlerinemataceae cyanobacterium]